METRFNIAFISFVPVDKDELIYDYAHYNEILLGNLSTIILHKNKNNVPGKYKNRFAIIHYNYPDDIANILIRENYTHLYILDYTLPTYIVDDPTKLKTKLIYHYIYNEPKIINTGWNTVVIGQCINKHYNTNYPILPPIVEENPNPHYSLRETLREKYNIPQYGIVFGIDKINIDFVKNVICNILIDCPNIWFLPMTEYIDIDYSNPRVITPCFDKWINVNMCDAFIHANEYGSTFGSKCAYFSVSDKRIIAYGLSQNDEHIRILKHGKETDVVIYNNAHEFECILTNFICVENYKVSERGYKRYTPEYVMTLFDEMLLK